MATDRNWMTSPQSTRPVQQQTPMQQPASPRYPTTPIQQQPSRQPVTPMQQQPMTQEFPETITGEDLGIPPMSQQGPPTLTDQGYVPGYLRTLIGQVVRAEFIINNVFMDKTGVLEEVGVNYFVLNDLSLGHRVMCDLYSARFITSMGRQPLT